MNRLLIPALCSASVFLVIAFSISCSAPSEVAEPNPKPLEWAPVADWLKLPEGMESLGASHGDVAIAKNGDVYISLTGGLRAGIQVYDATGNFLRVVEGAPNDFHGFVIHEDADGVEYIYGPRLTKGNILKMTLEGEVVLDIPATAIPEEHWKVHPKTKKKGIRLTACDIAPNGDIFVTDGYSSDLIHRFSPEGDYLATFGGKEAPYLFQTLHKIAIDTRFDPPRIVGVSRTDGRVVHLSLDGEFIGDVATDLLKPAALVVQDDLLAVGEILGRVTLIDKEGNIVKQLGANENEDEVGTNKTEPAKWRTGVVNAPHGVAFNTEGDLFVTEYSLFGRIVKYDRAD
ncbi:MAG: hypothetical protein P1U58_15810 [Verrucomicrobiales bacterium]|nr:hypothetical protein [Verrucomicrobiales bacterium]